MTTRPQGRRRERTRRAWTHSPDHRHRRRCRAARAAAMPRARRARIRDERLRHQARARGRPRRCRRRELHAQSVLCFCLFVSDRPTPPPTEDWPRALAKALGDTLLDSVIDSAGGPIAQQAGRLLRPGGRVVLYGMTIAPQAPLTMREVLRNQQLIGESPLLFLPPSLLVRFGL
jgi:hypothetical protein